MAMATRDVGKNVNSDINVTPMVDVMLVLLIIFMVVTPMIQNKVNVDLPAAKAAVIKEDANKEDAITVAVARDGKVYLGGDQVQSDDLGPKVQALLDAKKGDKEVYLRGDNRAQYGRVMEAIDGLRAGGVSSLGMLTEKPLGE